MGGTSAAGAGAGAGGGAGGGGTVLNIPQHLLQKLLASASQVSYSERETYSVMILAINLKMYIRYTVD